MHTLFSRPLRLIVPVGLFFGLTLAGLLHRADAEKPIYAADNPVGNRPEAPPLKTAEREEQGLTVTFYPAGSEDKPEAGDARSSRMAALYVPAGSPPSSFLKSGPFTALFEGNLNMRLRDSYSFSAEGRGDVTVTINDKEVFKSAGDFSKTEPAAPVRLNKGKNKLVVRYQSPAEGDASFRLLWTVKGETYPDPVPPMALTHDAGAEQLAKGMRLRHGRQLVADLRCTRCHGTPELKQLLPTGDFKHSPENAAALILPNHLMSEIGADAPDLSDAGMRLNQEWMTAWINNPHALRPSAHMPRLFAAPNDAKDKIDPRAADVAAYLASLGKANPTPIAKPDEKTIARGGQLFTHLHCVACHEQPGAAANAAQPAAAPAEGADAAADASPGQVRVPLRYVKAKFKPGALARFLLNPQAHYDWIPMPNFRFSQQEAEAVAAFLLSEVSAELPANLPAGDPAKGKEAIATSGCLNCHSVGESRSSLKTAGLNEIPKDGWARGCLATDAAGRKTAPQYDLTDDQRQAIMAFAATDRSSLYRDTPAEFSQRQVAAMNCAGCHARDGKESLVATTYEAELKDLEGKYPAPKGETAEAFAPDQRAPLMTWFGEKLQPGWANFFIAGEIKYKPRPYLHARMPAFPARAPGLAFGLAAEHGCPPLASAPVASNEKPDPQKQAIGSKLVGRTPNESFSCVQCHAVAKQPPFAPFEAPAVNFMYTSERINKDYYHRWVHNPLKLDPNTKMPAFERDDGKTTIVNVYDGDARKQFEAIWQYLLEGKDIKPPAE
jgi:mono/diheme cytochrome c family protein